MDPTMDFMMHHPEHVSPSSSIDHSARSACPALRAAAEHNQHSSMFPNRPSYQFDPVHNNPHFWQGLPVPYSRWSPESAYQSSPPIMPPNTGQMSQPPYPSNGSNTYTHHQSSSYRYRTPMLSLQRIGGTAPVQHSQGNYSSSANSGQNQPQVGVTGGPGTGPGALGSRTNNSTLPSLNSIPPPQTTSQTLQTPASTQTSHPTHQSGRFSPPPFLRQSSMPSTSLSMAEVTVSSSTPRDESGSSHSGMYPFDATHRNALSINTTAASSSPPRRAQGSHRAAESTNELPTPESRRTSTTRSRRAPPPTRLLSSESGLSSDEDSDPDSTALFLEAAAVSGGTVPGEHSPDERMRAHQLMRGAVSSKRVASKKAITSLESVTISSLPDNERTCVICYNDYGVETPEGISENPLRLPKCKHVFGDHCIKKWFEESDSCPYCRDKVPSEPQYQRQAMNAHNIYRFIRQQQNMHWQQMSMRNPGDRERGESDPLSRPNDAMLGHFPLASGAFAELEYGAGALGGPAARRADGMPTYSSRTPAWHGNSGDRHSPLPFNEPSETRRRSRPRHNSLRGFSLGRPPFGVTQANGNPQAQYQHPWLGRPNPGHSHNRQHGASSSANTAPRPNFDSPPFQFQPHMGVPSEPYLNPLNISSTGGSEEYAAMLPQIRSVHMGPLSPTYPGPEVYMTNADDTAFGGPVPHQQL
ncbi:hypothetical protein F5Y04DRAFT_6237 [Hypomontagnella monticulosa]|nr:hypothetical protein F5Y04DRAFT_6237 [Hypomontagnella monticulosa]